MKKIFIDIGGTHLRCEIVSDTQTLSEVRSSHDQMLMAYIEEKIAQYGDVEFVGISYAGQVDEGVILSSPNIRVDEADIKAAIESRYDLHLEIDNDLNCALMAEAEYWDTDNIAALYVGTGIGAAVMERGAVIRGSRNLAYEIGHIPYHEAPFACGCGRNNCIELYASGSGLAKRLRFEQDEREPDLHAFEHSDKENERRIAADFETALLYALGTLITLANPELIVLGGGIIEQNPYLMERIGERISSFALRASLDTLRIEQSRLTDAPLRGAKLLEKRKNG